MKAFGMGNPAIMEMLKQRGMAGMAGMPGMNLNNIKMEASTKQEFLANMNATQHSTNIGTPGLNDLEAEEIGTKRTKRETEAEEGITTTRKPTKSNGEIKIEDNNAE